MVADKKIAWPSQLSIGGDGMGNSLNHIREIMCESIEGCIAFNTLGYFKNNIVELTKSPYFSTGDGIYIDKEYYFDVFKDQKKRE